VPAAGGVWFTGMTDSPPHRIAADVEPYRKRGSRSPQAPGFAAMAGFPRKLLAFTKARPAKRRSFLATQLLAVPRGPTTMSDPPD
jgi:hypothetical protein